MSQKPRHSNRKQKMKPGIESRNYFEKLKNRGEKSYWKKKRSWQNRGRGIRI